MLLRKGTMLVLYSSTDGEPLLPGPDTFLPGTGPIFIHRLNCPSGSPDDYNEAYVSCLNEAILGQSECSHNDDIGVRCTGMHIVYCVVHAWHESVFMFISFLLPAHSCY